MNSGALPGHSLYDDPEFFAGYQHLRTTGAGLNEELEQAALARLLLPVSGTRVVELGCGDGSLARRLANAGAQQVIAVDSSRRMLALAGRHPHLRVCYLHSDIETLQLPAASADRVVSSLALHYVSDYRGLILRIASWLRPGGQLVFSIEHPICTAASPMSGWRPTGDTTVWPVDNYTDETTRTQEWLGRTVRKHHRRLTSLIGGVLEAGLALTGLDEPWPSDETIARHPDLTQHRRRPPLLLLAAAKPALRDPAARPVAGR